MFAYLAWKGRPQQGEGRSGQPGCRRASQGDAAEAGADWQRAVGRRAALGDAEVAREEAAELVRGPLVQVVDVAAPLDAVAAGA